MKDTTKEKKKKSLPLRILSIVYYCIFALVLILATFAFVNSVVLKNETDLFGYKIYYVKSDSMEPTFPVGTVLLEKKQKNYEELDTGTIITFDTIRNGERIINTHRIVGYYYEHLYQGQMVKERDNHNFQTADEFYAYYHKNGSNDIRIVGYATKGDRVDLPEDTEPVLFNQIHSTYVKKLPVLTVVYGLLKNIVFLVLLIIIPLFVFAITQLVIFLNHKKIAKTEEELNALKLEQEKRQSQLKEEAIQEYIDSQKKNF